MMTDQRLQMEKQVLSQKLPSNAFRFMDMNTSKPYIIMAAMTNSKNVYTLHINLEDFPNAVPKVFVTKMLYTKDGKRMDGPSGSMHTLSSENGWTRICHYGTGSWTPMVSLYKVYIKCRLWLEIYEQHLRNGKPMDYYLNHQA